jgi:hypothetical protein
VGLVGLNIYIYSTKHLTSEQYLQSAFWDWAESYKAYKCPLPLWLVVAHLRRNLSIPVGYPVKQIR